MNEQTLVEKKRTSPPPVLGKQLYGRCQMNCTFSRNLVLICALVFFVLPRGTAGILYSNLYYFTGAKTSGAYPFGILLQGTSSS